MPFLLFGGAPLSYHIAARQAKPFESTDPPRNG